MFAAVAPVFARRVHLKNEKLFAPIDGEAACVALNEAKSKSAAALILVYSGWPLVATINAPIRVESGPTGVSPLDAAPPKIYKLFRTLRESRSIGIPQANEKVRQISDAVEGPLGTTNYHVELIAEMSLLHAVAGHQPIH